MNPDGSASGMGVSEIPYVSEQVRPVGDGLYGKPPHYGFPISGNPATQLLTLEERAAELADFNRSAGKISEDIENG